MHQRINMPLILNLDTSTQVCSVALSAGSSLLGKRESREEKSHSRLLAVFIQEILKETHLNPSDLNAIAVSTGPGSYTGLRIGVSTAKGLAYGSSIPLIGIGTLDLLVSGGLRNPDINILLRRDETSSLCPMIDARRMEVYTALYNASGEIIESISAKIIDKNSFIEKLDSGPVLFFGNGAKKCRGTISHRNAIFIDEIEASAEDMIQLSEKAWQEKKFEDLAYFEPHYLKDFIATIPRNTIISGNQQ